MPDYLHSHIDDIIFENRNKAYGAYMLRKVYNKHVFLAFIAAFILAMIIVGTPYISKMLSGFTEEEVPPPVLDKEIILSEPPPIDEKELPPPPPEMAPPKPPKQVKFVPPVIKPDEEVPEDEPEPVPDVEELENVAIGTVDVEGDELDAFEPPPPPVDLSGGTGSGTGDEPLDFVEQMPVFGDGEFSKFLQKNLRYPSRAVENEVMGKVYVQFTVNRDGSIVNAKVVKGIGYGCDEEALRVIKKSTGLWKPGKQNGMAVRVRYTQAIQFKLSQ